MRYFVSGGSFDRSAVVIDLPPTIVCIYVLAVRRELNRSIWYVDSLFGLGREGITPKTGKVGTEPFGPVPSFIAFRLRRSLYLSSIDACSDRTTLKTRRVV